MKLNLRLNLNFRTRLILGILLITITAYIITVSVIVYSFYQTTQKKTLSFTDNILELSSRYLGLILDRDLDIVRTVKVSLQNIRTIDDEHTFLDLQEKICKDILIQTPQFLSLSINWERKVLLHDPSLYGRVRYEYYRNEGKLGVNIDTLEVEGDNILGLYYKYKILMREGLSDPYFYSYTPHGSKILMTSLFSPFVSKNQFQGLVVADVALEHFYQLLEEIKPFEYVDLFLLSYSGRFVAFTLGDKWVNQDMIKYFGQDIYSKVIEKNYKQGIPFTFRMRDSLGDNEIVSFYPIRIGNFDEPWYVGSIVPLKTIRQPFLKLVRVSVAVSLIMLVILLVFLIILARSFTIFLSDTEKSLAHLAKGEISEKYKLVYGREDELGSIARNVNVLIDNLMRLSDFAKEIGSGNLDANLEKISDNDILGEAFLDMQRSLKISRIEEKRRQQEEEIQNWIVHGENMFAGILREYSNNIEELSYQVISNLVRYTGAVQGGLFIINDEDPENKTIDLVAAYAYDRRKYLEKSIPYGVGLIGRSVMEGETIYISDVPQDYLSVTSGLGDRHPSSLLIVPFKFNEVIYAVVEIASFEGFRAHIRRFVERIGVSVASTIANVKITEQTRKLVEQLRARSHELASQEEEMRQNLEEMRATQEELRKKAVELENIVAALDKIAYVAEFDTEGNLINVNERFLMLLRKKKEDVLRKPFYVFLPDKGDEKYMEDMWKDLSRGIHKLYKTNIIVGNSEYWLNIALVPLHDEYGGFFKVILIATDITQYIKK